MQHNKLGFVIKGETAVEVFSIHSALTGQKIKSGGVTLPLDIKQGLYCRLSSIEARQLTNDQRAELLQRGKAWLADREAKARAKAEADAERQAKAAAAARKPKAEKES